MNESPLCCTFAVAYDHSDCRVKARRLQFSFVAQIIVRTVRWSTRKQTVLHIMHMEVDLEANKESLWVTVVAKDSPSKPHHSNSKQKWHMEQHTNKCIYLGLTQTLPSRQTANTRKTTRGDAHDRSGRIDVHQIIPECVHIKDVLFVRRYLSSWIRGVESCQWIHDCYIVLL